MPGRRGGRSGCRPRAPGGLHGRAPRPPELAERYRGILVRVDEAVKVHVTGASGFLGGRVMLLLVAVGHEATAMARKEDRSSMNLPEGAQSLVIDTSLGSFGHLLRMRLARFPQY